MLQHEAPVAVAAPGDFLSDAWRDFIAGAVAGAFAITVSQPLDTVRVRIQAEKASSQAVEGTLSVLRRMVAREGILSPWKGLTYPLLFASVQSAILFQVYGWTLRQLAASPARMEQEQGAAAGAGAGPLGLGAAAGSGSGGGGGGAARGGLATGVLAGGAAGSGAAGPAPHPLLPRPPEHHLHLHMHHHLLHDRPHHHHHHGQQAKHVAQQQQQRLRDAASGQGQGQAGAESVPATGEEAGQCRGSEGGQQASRSSLGALAAGNTNGGDAGLCLAAAAGGLAGAEDEEPGLPTPTDGAIAGAVAGMAQVFLWSPVELLKLRAQLQTLPPGAPGYHNPAQLAMAVLRQDGPAGLYRGFTLTVVRDAPSYAMYFYLYHAIASRLNPGLHPEQAPPLTQVLAGGLAGVIAWLPIYPLDVIKTRVQAQGGSAARGLGWRHYAGQMYREGGLRAFWLGVGPTLARAFVMDGASFLGYTSTLKALAPSGGQGGAARGSLAGREAAA